MSFTFVTPFEVTVGAASAWTDVDLTGQTGYPGDGTCIGVLLQVRNTNTSTDRAIGFRKNGSTDNRVDNLNSDFNTLQTWVYVGVDSGGIFEAYSGNTTDIDVYVCGYFTSEAVFNTNAADVSLGSTGAWTDIDLNVNDSAKLAFIETECSGNDFTDRTFGLRCNGSTDNRASGRTRQHFWHAIGVDASEIFEANIGHTDVDMYVVGYMKDQVTVNTNGIDFGANASGAWTDYTLSTGALGGFIEVYVASGTAAVWGLRKNGSSQDFKGRQNGNRLTGMIEADGSYIVEYWNENTSQDLFETAILVAAAGGGGTVITRTLSDSIVTADGFAGSRERDRKTIDSAVVRDGASRLAELFRLRADQLSVADVLSLRSVEMFRLLTDSLAVNDALIKQITGVIVRALSDSLVVTDTRYRELELYRMLSDPLNTSDAAVSYRERFRAAAESVQVQEAMLRVFILDRLLQDTSTVTDTARATLEQMIRDVARFILTKIAAEPIETEIAAAPIITSILVRDSIEVDIL